jgi:hypothetical protein
MVNFDQSVVINDYWLLLIESKEIKKANSAILVLMQWDKNSRKSSLE